MALTKVTGQVINDTTGLVVGVTTVGGGLSATDGFFSGIVTAVGNASFSGNLTVGGVLTYEDVTNVDSVGLITARNGIVVGSGITLSKDGDGFYTGVVTATTFSGAFSGDGSALTGVANTDVIFTDKLQVGDSPELISVGVGSDLQLLHSGGNSFIQNNTGYLGIQADTLYLQDKTDGHAYITCVNDGAVGLRYDNSEKLATSNTGVTVTGTVAATSYTGDGSALTGIEVGMSTASAQVSGITTVVDLSKDDIRLDCTGLVTIDTKGGTEGGNHVLRIVNSGISTVSFSSYFKFPSGASPALPTASGAISLISFTVHTQGRVGVASVFLAGASVNFS